jgi:hypothetical protein
VFCAVCRDYRSYNTDIAMVGPPMTPLAAKAQEVSLLPPHQWVMIFECVVVPPPPPHAYKICVVYSLMLL